MILSKPKFIIVFSLLPGTSFRLYLTVEGGKASGDSLLCTMPAIYVLGALLLVNAWLLESFEPRYTDYGFLSFRRTLNIMHSGEDEGRFGRIF